MVKGADVRWQEQDQGREGADTEGEGAGHRGDNSCLLADPRLVEAHDNSTVMQPTGADRSAPRTHPVP